jgi:hypothetical protein
VKLLNCKNCDDVLKLTDFRTRTCECGACTGTVDAKETAATTGPARVFDLPWSEYDQAADSAWHKWRLASK